MLRRLRPRFWIALGVVAAAFAMAGWFVHARVHLVAPAPTLLLRDRHGEFLAEVGSDPRGDAGYWPVDPAAIPEKMVACTLAAEDHHFSWHPGVDPVAVVRAIRQNVGSGRRISGASTVAMQVARMQRSPALTLPTGRASKLRNEERSYRAKIAEAATALLLTARYGRQAVLAHYLTIAPYGNRTRGIGYAARRYFEKPAEDLSWSEAAFLAAIPQGPAKMNPLTATGKANAIARGKRILEEVHAEGALPDVEYTQALARIDTLEMPMPARRRDSSMHAVLELERKLTSPAARAALGRQTIIDTTLDAAIEEDVAWRVWSSLRTWESSGAGNAAAVVIDPSTAEVLAWVGSADYFDDAHSGSIDYARVPRSPGSALKPFFYALALDRGAITPATILDDLRGADGSVVNADPNYLGPLLPRIALANSRNTTAVEVIKRTGLGRSYELLGELGLRDREPDVPSHGTIQHGALSPIASMSESDLDSSSGALTYGLGLAVGNEPVALGDLVRAYTTLSGGGALHDLVWWRGQTVAPQKRIFSEDAAREIALFLSDPEARLPTFPRMGATELPFPVAVKTGTSNGYRDAWTVAWSGKYLVGVWVGHPAWRPMNGLSGYRSAAQLARQILVHLHSETADGMAALHGLQDVSFAPPRGATPVKICALTGKRATDACDHSLLEWFTPGTEPAGDCEAHVRRAIDRRNGLLATASTPNEFVDVRSFVDLPARYADWQSKSQLPRPPDEVSSIDERGFRARSGDAGSPNGRPEAIATQRVAARRATAASSEVRVASPRSGTVILRDPEAPAGASTLSLHAVVDPPSKQVVWYVDGKPWKVVPYPFTARWPLAAGAHTFQARLPAREETSAIVRVEVE